MFDDVKIRSLIQELAGWPGPSISSHKSARQFFHKLSFLADIGITVKDKGMKEVVSAITAHRDGNGIPQLPVTISKAYGGSGEETWGWALCDAPTVLYALSKIGHSDKATEMAISHVAGFIRENGWGCSVSKELGSWRGPGKKSDPCPYATLIMTKLLLERPDAYRSEIACGAKTILDLWEKSLTEHPYIFYMGDDFRKLKLPFVWYDILHVADVLSRIPEARKEKRFLEMWGIIDAKPRDDGGYIPESVYLPWKAWDFGQKKIGSPWMTFCIERIRQRVK